MRLILVPLIILLSGCAAQTQVVGPFAAQLSHADIQQITALMPADHETMTHTSTKLDVIRPDRVRVTVVGFGKDTRGVPTSGSSSYIFTAVKRNGRWDHTDEVEVERELKM